MLEQLLLGSKVTVLGLAAVFAGLILLIVVIELMHKAAGNEKEKYAKQSSDIEKAFEKIEKIEKNQTSVEKANSVDEDDELIAVISAAVAVALSGSTHEIVVKSIKRIESHSPVWNRISRQEQIRTRL